MRHLNSPILQLRPGITNVSSDLQNKDLTDMLPSGRFYNQ
jgi:hypothetical protein